MRLPLLLWTLALPSALHGERAILECVADGSVSRDGALEGSAAALEMDGERKAILLNFRFSLATGWRIEKATLLLHVAEGSPTRLRTAPAPTRWSEKDARAVPPRKRAGAGLETLPQGWIQVEIDAATIQKIAGGEAFGLWLWSESPCAVHSRESLHSAPYMVVEGHSR
jgi:hypothetical protein